MHTSPRLLLTRKTVAVATISFTSLLVAAPVFAATATPVATQKDALKVGIPATGKGSLKGMAVDPAATAASNNPQLTTLVAAVKAAGLVDTLNGPGPFTIFAPANSAFAKLPAGTVDSLVKPENKASSRRSLRTMLLPERSFRAVIWRRPSRSRRSTEKS